MEGTQAYSVPISVKQLSRSSLCEPWETIDPERKCINNQVFYTYYQQLCVLIVRNPRITKEVTYMYIKSIIFIVDMQRIYIKLRDVKGVDWNTVSYQMEQEDVEQIVREWLEEWNNSTIDVSDSDKEK